MLKKIFSSFLFATTCMISFCLHADSNYGLRPITFGPHHEPLESIATEINVQGHVAGMVATSSGFFFERSSPFYSDGDHDAHVLEDIRCAPGSYPVLNHHDQIIGTHMDKGWVWNEYVGYTWHPFLGLHLIPLKEGWSAANVVRQNDAGYILMMNKRRSNCFCRVNKNLEAEVCVYRDGAFIEIPFMTEATAINNGNQVLGRAFQMKEAHSWKGTHLEEVSYPVIYNLENHTLQTIPFNEHAYGVDLNDKGQVIGLFLDNKKWKGFFWDPKEGLAVLEDFFPVSINNRSQVLGMNGKGGMMYMKGETIYIWNNHQTVKVNIASEHLMKGVDVQSINDKGEIAGGFRDEHHKMKAMVLYPLD